MMLAIFDVDNTLVDRRAALRCWGDTFLRREGLPSDLLDVIVAADADGVTPRNVFLENIHNHFAVKESIDEFHDWYFQSYIDCFKTEPESVAAVSRLRAAGWVIAAASNGPAAKQALKLRNAGLSHLIDVLCTSDQVGHEKPDPRIFHEVARRTGCALDGWVIGDDARADIWGGQQAGLRTAWLSHGRTWNYLIPAPDVVASRLNSVVDQILGLP